MYDIIPDEIETDEPLTHALFHKSDVNKNTGRLKEKAFRPPKKSPHEVSFNRACYMPDDAQKEMATNITREHSVFVGFVRMTQRQLDKALEKLKCHQQKSGQTPFESSVYFSYSPIYDANQPDEKWPSEVDKKWGNGYNPAHCDLYYEHNHHLNREANSFVLALTSIFVESVEKGN